MCVGVQGCAAGLLPALLPDHGPAVRPVCGVAPRVESGEKCSPSGHGSCRCVHALTGCVHCLGDNEGTTIWGTTTVVDHNMKSSGISECAQHVAPSWHRAPGAGHPCSITLAQFRTPSTRTSVAHRSVRSTLWKATSSDGKSKTP